VGKNFLLPVASVISIYLIVVVLSLVVRVLQLPLEIWSWIFIVVRTLKPLLITVILYKLVDVVSVYFTKLANRTESSMDDQLVPLLRK
jgi:MscS family membrane protein